MPGSSWPSKHKDDFLPDPVTCWVYSSTVSFLHLEVRAQYRLQRDHIIYLQSYSLPGAIGMYALSLGVQKIGDTLPLPVYALLSGLNSSTVGIIALAAVQLAEKAIRDRLTRILVIFGACAGLCHNSLWYFPLLMVLGGLASIIWDGWMSQQIRKIKLAWRRRHTVHPTTETELATMESAPMEEGGRNPGSNQIDNTPESQRNPVRSRNVGPRSESVRPSSADTPFHQDAEEHPLPTHRIRIRVGILITVCFFGEYLPHSWLLIPHNCN